jgi:hypothetical protein
MFLLVVKGEFICRQKTRNRLLLAGMEVDPLEAAQFFGAAVDATVRVADVELDDLVAGASAGVFHIHGHRHDAVRRDLICR